jgi:opacity protein-like surface antigen
MRRLPWAIAATLWSLTALATTVVDNSEASPLVTSGNIVGGAGFGDFSTTRADISIGTGWEARAGVVLVRYAGLEANYQGLSNSVNSASTGAFMPTGSHVLLTELTADVVPGIPIMLGDHELRPYTLVGVGYGNVSNATITSIGTASISTVAVPLGAGLSFQVTKGFMVDTRFTYNFLSDPAASNWNLGFNLGATFGPQ